MKNPLPAAAWLILLLALLLRVGYMVATPGYELVHDATDYDRAARTVAAGEGWPLAHGRATTFRPPAYPLLLAGVYKVAGVERGTKHEPPVQRVTEPARALVQPTARPHTHECMLVVDEVFELVASEMDPGRVVAAPGTDMDAVLAGEQRPGIAVDLDRHRAQVEALRAGRHRVAARVKRSGEVVLEELPRVDCLARPVRAGAQIDRHA